MAGDRAYLKENDTRPILEVTLKDPDGSVHNLSGADSVALHIYLNDGTVLTRAMVIDAAPATGKVTYSWVPADWTNGLFVGPTLPLSPGDVDHKMEYEVVGPSPARLTFPNDGYDYLTIYDDLGPVA